MQHLVLATRASPLAMWQARRAASLLRSAWPGLAVRLLPVTSTGDRDRTTPLYGMGGVGVFAREVHDAVRDGRADVGVHSAKDLPTTPPEGIAPPLFGERSDPRDALIGARRIEDLPQGATVGSSSLRRRAQLAVLRPDLRFVDIRGNVATRLRKIREGEADATLLAMAGLHRLRLVASSGAVAIDPGAVIPAPGQGALALDHRLGDRRARVLLSPIVDRSASTAVGIERAVLAGLRGGCASPLGCHVARLGRRWRLRARYCPDAGPPREAELTGPSEGLSEAALQRLAGS